MTVAPSSLTDLLADCEAQGIRLLLASDSGLTIDAPENALTPDLLGRLKAHKADVVAMLRPASGIDPRDATALWQAALGRLEGDPLFPPAMLAALRQGVNAQWEGDTQPGDRATAPGATASAPAVCRCGSTRWRDVPVHGGQSLRRDCGRCGQFLDFPVWYGKDTGHNGQHPI